VDIDRPNWRWVGSVDLLALPLLAVFLGSLQLVSEGKRLIAAGGSTEGAAVGGALRFPAVAARSGAVCAIGRR